MEKDLVILHLSDLHISKKEDSNHGMLRDGLLKDLQNLLNVNKLKVDIIAITGDIIDKGNGDAFDIAYGFIDKIRQITGGEAHLVMVPGNHDMKRSDIYSNALQDDKIQQDGQDEDVWDIVRVRMKNYREFVSRMLPDDSENIQDGYGLKQFIINGKKINIQLINTSWSNKGNDDYNHLIVGRWQLEHIRSMQRESGADLSIALTHHPLDWLVSEQKEMLEDYMRNHQKLDTNIILHGHVHNVRLKVQEYPDKRIVELTSGFGYPESENRAKGQPKIEKCRYALYGIDFQKNDVTCWCRISNDSGAFVADTEAYGNVKTSTCTFSWGKATGQTNSDNEDIKTVNEIELDPVPQVACWSGRDDELETLGGDRYKVVMVSGVGGQGKTALAVEFMRRQIKAESKRFMNCLWVDCRELQDTMHVKLLQLLEKLTGGKDTVQRYKDETVHETIQRFYGFVKSQPTLIIFDNVDAYVDLDNSELTGELSELVQVMLTREHKSMIILTCRIPIYDSNACFGSVKLDGLKEPDAIHYFKQRGMNLEQDEDDKACKEIIRVTKGHPWWIGLIIGQMQLEKVSISNYLSVHKDDLLTKGSQVENYFDSIWKTIGEIKENYHKIIRHLVESVNPLTVDEISRLLQNSYNQTNKAINKLYRWNLLIRHEGAGSPKYQVHPLVREYIHKKYDVESQKPYMLTVVKWLIGSDAYEQIINQVQVFENNTRKTDIVKIIDSIETCLNARDASQALLIVSSYINPLEESGCHAEILSLGLRILNEIDWKKEQVGKVRIKAAFLAKFIDLLSIQMDKDKAGYYLKMYEDNCEKNTLPYGAYLSLKAFVNWRQEDWDEGLAAVKEFKNLLKIHSDIWTYQDIDSTEGLLLRDSGQSNAALSIFNNLPNNASKYGNIARCYQMTGDHEQALSYLRKSLEELMRTNSISNMANRGYAFLWLAEIYEMMGDLEKAVLYLYLAKNIWGDVAPGLLRCTVQLQSRLNTDSIEAIDEKAEEALALFMAEG